MNSDIAQRGTITNKETGDTLHGIMSERVLQARNANGFDFRIDGTQAFNTFFWSDWDFEPEAPKLPTEIGSVIQVTKWCGDDRGQDKSCRVMLTAGGWHWAMDRTPSWTAEKLQAKIDNGSIEWEQVL